MFKISAKSFLAFIFFVFWIVPVYAQQTFQIKNNAKKTRIAFIKAGNLMILKTYINNKGPFNFVLDSGVGLMVITDTSLKDSLQLSYIKEIKIAGLGEAQDLEAYLTPNLKVTIGHTAAKNVGAVILKHPNNNLSLHAGMAIHGLIGFDFFNSFVVKTFYQSGYLQCFNYAAYKAHKKAYQTRISIENRKPYCFINVAISKTEKYQLKTIIDCGAGHALSLESLHQKDFPLPKKNIPASLGTGLGGKINGHVGRINEVKMANYTIKNLLCAFPSLEDVAQKVSTPRQASIGNNLLKQFNVVYNYAENYMQLIPLSRKFPELEHNMSGIELITGGKSYRQFFIEEVNYPNIDVQTGDELVAINFKPTKTMSLEEINDILHEKAGNDIFITVLRNKQFHYSVITLKKII